MKKNEISLSKEGYDILKYFEASEDLPTSNVIEFSLILFNELYKKYPTLLFSILETINNKSK